ncbi:MAG: S1C family serine protease, partial [Faecousia sp.]
MDTFENNNSDPINDVENSQPAPEEPTPPQPEKSQSSFYSGAGTGRKESPYANSPYVTNQGGSEYQYQPQSQPPQKPMKEKKPRKPIWKGVLAVVLVVALVAGGCLITAVAVNEHWEEQTENTVEDLNRKIEDLQNQIDQATSSDGTILQLPGDGSAMTPSQVYSHNVDSVVAITSTIQTSSFYGTSTGTSSGSGFILTEDGYIVSNYHVVEGATEIKVTLHDGSEYPAELVGYDSTNDLSVLKIEAEGLSAAAIGSSSDLNIGDMVVAIG